jgi:ABC-type polysaccharide/polyol phosphate transport system ATPase subunit
MADTVIRAEGLGKRYLIGHQAERERYTALRDVIARGVRGLARSAADLARGRPLVAGDRVEEFWALKDVSFEVKRGEVVGIIGRNGAGKSTLLKILSRITEPSAGRVTICGRVASLLEVGTGFHPELTGRENIYLNGAILGMTRAEIRRKFDEIVAFAEVERFLDTPVKRYSSGMYVRLAFAVAAHLEPEILVIDEVLAVGDAEFQKKCLGKMGEVARGGRTVLFVSHNMGAVASLCSSAAYLKDGFLHYRGAVLPAVGQYSARVQLQTSCKLRAHSDAILEGQVSVTLAENICFRVEILTSRATRLACEAKIRDSLGQYVAYAEAGVTDSTHQVDCLAGRSVLELRVPANYLAAGRYTATIDLTNPFVAYIARAEDGLSFDIESTSSGTSRQMAQTWGLGSIRLPSSLRSWQPSDRQVSCLHC